MSWFERRQQAAKLEVEVEPAVVPVLDTAPEQQRRVRKEPRRAAAIPSEDDDGDYLTPESLDPNKPEFPKLVDPPFRSANVPLELRPSDELKGGQATLDAPPVDAAALTVPASAAQYLREYQKEGVKWLYQQYIRQLGGVLGDDMVRLRS